jgi:hypothetical protein
VIEGPTNKNLRLGFNLRFGDRRHSGFQEEIREVPRIKGRHEGGYLQVQGMGRCLGMGKFTCKEKQVPSKTWHASSDLAMFF